MFDNAAVMLPIKIGSVLFFIVGTVIFVLTPLPPVPKCEPPQVLETPYPVIGLDYQKEMMKYHPEYALERAEYYSRKVVKGIAEDYPDDVGLEKDPNILFYESFETAQWMKKWFVDNYDEETVTSQTPIEKLPPPTRLDRNANLEQTTPMRDFLYFHLQGRALKVKIPQGAQYGCSLKVFFKSLGEEPEHLFLRYYLFLGADWNPSDVGKLPGLAGTYGKAGWGGRKSTGQDGWSARIQYHLADRDGRTPLGFYAYHVDQKSKTGDHLMWMRREPAASDKDRMEGVNPKMHTLALNRWYCIEMEVKLNTPDAADGLLRGWIDGVQVYENTTMRFRTTADLKIETLWLNVFHGGKTKAKSMSSLYFDNIAVSRKYVGPIEN